MKTERIKAKRTLCPSCNQKGKRVGLVTLSALLKVELGEPIDTDSHQCANSSGVGCTSERDDSGWRFCDSVNCDVVYFTEVGETIFTRSQLKVSVGIKETTGERPLCYCFGHSIASIKDELRTRGRTNALEDIRAKMKDPGCRCETENPSGTCCLGSVSKGIMVAQGELSTTQSSPTNSIASLSKGETLAKVGTLASAIVASSCCWLPLVLLAVGVSGAGIASTLEAYRPLFIVITLGFLGAAFYFTYRPQNSIKTDAGGCCATEPSNSEECCETTTKGCFNAFTFNKVVLWAVTVLAITFLLFPNYVGIFLESNGQQNVGDNMNRAVIKVEGMTCEGCASLVASAIRKTAGVLAVEVNYEDGTAIVGTDICCPVPKTDILVSLQEAGYDGVFVNVGSPAKH